MSSYFAGLAQWRLRLICNEELPGVRVPPPAPRNMVYMAVASVSKTEEVGSNPVVPAKFQMYVESLNFSFILARQERK